VATASTPIFTEAGSNTVRMTFHFIARKPDGEPLADEECPVTLEGDGSFAPRHDAKTVLRTTNAEGVGEVIWYRRGIYGRDVHATLTVETPDDGSVTIKAVAPATA
jgi:hypothetical protein